MKRPVIQAFCDIDYAEHDKALIPAVHIDVPLTIGKLSVNLDMCDACLELVQKTLKRFTEPGQVTTQRRIDPASRDHYSRLREFADKRGISYRTPGGGYYYSRQLKQQFSEQEAIRP